LYLLFINLLFKDFNYTVCKYLYKFTIENASNKRSDSAEFSESS